MSEQNETQNQSPYRRLEKPEIKSAIPSHLLGKLSDQEKYVVEALSKMEHQNDWLINVALDTNRAVLDIDQRLRSVETWKTILTSHWTVIIGILVWLTPTGLIAILHFFLKKI